MSGRTKRRGRARPEGAARLVVVLDPSPTGSAALIAGLRAMGVDFEGPRPKRRRKRQPAASLAGDVAHLNQRILAALGVRWRGLAAIEDHAWQRQDLRRLADEAARTLAQHLGQGSTLGLVDPRLIRLWPFWKGVLTTLNVDATLLLALRHPREYLPAESAAAPSSAELTALFWLRDTATTLRAAGERPAFLLPVETLGQDSRRLVNCVCRAMGVSADTRRYQAVSAALDEHRETHAPDASDGLHESGDGRADAADGQPNPTSAQSLFQRACALHAELLPLARRTSSPPKRALQLVLRHIDDQLAPLRPLFAHLDAQATQIDVLRGQNSHLKRERDTLHQRVLTLGKRDKELARVQGSLAWRVSAPTRHIIDQAKRTTRNLARRSFSFELQPASQLRLNGNPTYPWRATGDDPHFLLRPRAGRLPHGWCRIELTLRSDQPHGVATLYADAGDGFSEASAIHLPLGRSGRARLYVYLQPHTEALRLDPTTRPCSFNLTDLRITEVPKLEAATRVVSGVLLDARRQGLTARGLVDKGAQVLRRQGWIGLKHWLKESQTRLPRTGAYHAWMQRHGSLSTEQRTEIQRRITRLPYRPSFSVVMPVHNTPEAWLRRAIESVRGQLYPDWQLCVADDASTRAGVRALLDEAAASDPRIQVTYRATNGHISAASNSALALAQGEFVALLDHDDELSEDALYRVAVELNDHRDAAILYSDEDKIDAQGNRHAPHFKPDWNPDLFYSLNYLSHLGVYRRDLVESVGGFREGFEGSQDYDLALRCSALVEPENIRHIPRVLYHWRAVAGSTARASSEKSYASDAAIHALRDHFAAGKMPVVVEPGLWPTTYRPRWPIPRDPPKVSIIIPTRDGYEILKRCVDSIVSKTTYGDFEIIIVDNQSSDARTLRYLQDLGKGERVRVLRYDKPFNFSAINNYAVRRARGELVALVNNDIEVIGEEWLTEMVSHALRPDIGAVGAKLLYGDGTVQHGGVILGIGGVAGHAHKYLSGRSHGYFSRLGVVQNLSAVTAACLVVRKALYQEVGGMEERALAIAFNDVDFCLRLRRAGYRNLWTPYAELFHHESATRGAENTPEKRARFAREMAFMRERWGPLLSADPCYNPNLTVVREDFSLGDAPAL